MKEQRGERVAGFGLPKMLIEADMFPAQIPSFNSKGRDAIKTYFGGLNSLIINYLFFLFALVKFQQLVTRHNPQIVEYVETNAFDATDEFNPGEDEGFMIAVGFVDHFTGEAFNDPRYLKWLDNFYAYESGVLAPKLAQPMQPCTEEDYQKFHPPDKSAAPIVENLKKAGALFCLDSELLKTQALRGGLGGGDNTVLDLMAVPCHAKETALGGDQDYIREDCVREPEAVYAYLDNMAMVTWYNYSVFKHGKFEKDERVMNYSAVKKYNTKVDQSSWRAATVHVSNLNDETDFF